MPIIISLILIVVCLVIILIIILKKFPALAILDVANLPGQKEAKFKDQLLQKRVERDLARGFSFLSRWYLALVKHWSNFLQGWHKRLKNLKLTYRLQRKIPSSEKAKRLKALFLAADELFAEEDYSEAENKLIEIIKLDQKNLQAFFKLGELYEAQKKWPEASQTYEHTLKLLRQSPPLGNGNDLTPQKIYFSLAEVAKETADYKKALENIREALELEPNNPRFLDLILDLSIMKKDCAAAKEYWEKLAAVNPENNKLAEWRGKIEALAEKGN